MTVLASERTSPMVLEGSDRELVEACRRGERDAFRALFEAYKDRVYSIALRFAGDQAAAMDIAQDTFLKLFSCIGDFRGDAAFSTWVYRLVVNCCLDHKRKSWRLIPIADDLLAVRERIFTRRARLHRRGDDFGREEFGFAIGECR